MVARSRGRELGGGKRAQLPAHRLVQRRDGGDQQRLDPALRAIGVGEGQRRNHVAAAARPWRPSWPAEAVSCMRHCPRRWRHSPPRQSPRLRLASSPLIAQSGRGGPCPARPDGWPRSTPPGGARRREFSACRRAKVRCTSAGRRRLQRDAQRIDDRTCQYPHSTGCLHPRGRADLPRRVRSNRAAFAGFFSRPHTENESAMNTLTAHDPDADPALPDCRADRAARIGAHAGRRPVRAAPAVVAVHRALRAGPRPGRRRRGQRRRDAHRPAALRARRRSSASRAISPRASERSKPRPCRSGTRSDPSAIALSDQHALDAARVRLARRSRPSSWRPAAASRSRRRCSRPACPRRRRSATSPCRHDGHDVSTLTSPVKPSARSRVAPPRISSSLRKRTCVEMSGRVIASVPDSPQQRSFSAHRLSHQRVHDGQRRVLLHRRVAGVVVHVAHAR